MYDATIMLKFNMDKNNKQQKLHHLKLCIIIIIIKIFNYIYTTKY